MTASIRYMPWMLLILLCLGVGSGVVAQDGKDQAVKPLSLEGFLDEKLLDTSEEKGPVAEEMNGACYVCHGNYGQEALVVTHAEQDIGCIECHGESDDHRNDENNIIPPDTMIPLSNVDAFCMECHEEHNASARKVIERWQDRCSSKTNIEKIVCTDCHFNHRLTRRTVRWNKKTGQLIHHKDEKTN